MNMRKKILAICILLAIWPVVSYAQISEFVDGDTIVNCQYVGERQQYYGDWRQHFRDALLESGRKLGIYDTYPIEKLSKDDVRLINKALQRFEIMEDEIYAISTLSAYGGYGKYRSYAKHFFVLIKSKGQWDFVGVWYNL